LHDEQQRQREIKKEEEEATGKGLKCALNWLVGDQKKKKGRRKKKRITRSALIPDLKISR